MQSVELFSSKDITVLLTGHAQPKPVRSIRGDLCSYDDVQSALEGVDVVIHTAGVISYGIFPDYDRMQHVNVHGKLSLHYT